MIKTPLQNNITEVGNLSVILNCISKDTSNKLKLGDLNAIGFFIGYFTQLSNGSFPESSKKELLRIYLEAKEQTKNINYIFEIVSHFFTIFYCSTIKGYTNNNLSRDINRYIKKKQGIILQECKICLEDYDTTNEDNFILSCGCSIHSECFEDYLLNSINDSRLPLRCPLCDRIVNALDPIIEYLDDHDYKDQLYFLKDFMNQYCFETTDTIRCYCPNRDCDYSYLNFNKDPMFQCKKCDYEQCFHCKADHIGMTCPEYITSITYEEDALFDKFIEKCIKKDKELINRCPYCKIYYSYTNGCSEFYNYSSTKYYWDWGIECSFCKNTFHERCGMKKCICNEAIHKKSIMESWFDEKNN